MVGFELFPGGEGGRFGFIYKEHPVEVVNFVLPGGGGQAVGVKNLFVSVAVKVRNTCGGKAFNIAA